MVKLIIPTQKKLPYPKLDPVLTSPDLASNPGQGQFKKFMHKIMLHLKKSIYLKFINIKCKAEYSHHPMFGE